MHSEYYLPLDILQCIKSRPADFQRVIMPFFNTYHFNSPAHSSGSWQEAPTQQLAATSSKPQAYPPPQTQHSSTVDHGGFHNSPQNLQTNPHAGLVHAGSGQRNSESWVKFEAWMEKGLEAWKSVESKEEWQHQEAHKTYARKHGYSKKCSIYIWEQDKVDPTFYHLTLLSKAEVAVNWENFTACQCQFWPHKLHWDLCPQISPFHSDKSTQAKQARIADLDNSEDKDFNLLSSNPSMQYKKVHNKQLAEAMLESIRAAVTSWLEHWPGQAPVPVSIPDQEERGNNIVTL